MINEETAYEMLLQTRETIVVILRTMSTFMLKDDWFKMMNEIRKIHGLEEIKIEGKNDEASENN